MFLIMHMKDAFNNLLTGKLRSFLAVLGILVGTASVVAPVGSFHDDSGLAVEVRNPHGVISLGLKENLLKIQAGLIKSPFENWIYKVKSIE